MSSFASYRPSEHGKPAPEDLVVEMADSHHADGIARLYSDREGATTETARAWTRRVLDRISERWCVAIATSGGGVVGYGVAGWLEPEEAPDGFYLMGVIIDPDFRRRGIADVLTRWRIDWLRQRSTNVFYFANASNQATIDLHQAFGFRELKHLPAIAGMPFDGGDGILYEARFHDGS